MNDETNQVQTLLSFPQATAWEMRGRGKHGMTTWFNEWPPSIMYLRGRRTSGENRLNARMKTAGELREINTYTHIYTAGPETAFLLISSFICTNPLMEVWASMHTDRNRLLKTLCLDWNTIKSFKQRLLEHFITISVFLLQSFKIICVQIYFMVNPTPTFFRHTLSHSRKAVF